MIYTTHVSIAIKRIPKIHVSLTTRLRETNALKIPLVSLDSFSIPLVDIKNQTYQKKNANAKKSYFG